MALSSDCSSGDPGILIPGSECWTAVGSSTDGSGRELSNSKLRRFFERAASIVGAANVLDSDANIDNYARSTSSSTVRSLGIVKPASSEEVQQLVTLASLCEVALYPISRGCNWGLGDACPTTARQVILDLRRMNRITIADRELGALTIEPGVSQGDLFQFIQANDLAFWYDASAAGPDASVIGNLMERGYGHTPMGERFQYSCNYEVVLADGSCFRTGFGEDEANCVAHLFKPGIGPSLDGLFTQSNLGIVTRATIWLMPKPSYFEAFAFRIYSDQELFQAIAALQPLRASGCIQSTLHIGNDFRVLSAKSQYPYDQLDGLTPMGDAYRADLRKQHGIAMWNGLGAYYGTRRGAAAARHEIRRALRGITRPIFFNERKLSMASAVLDRIAWLPLVDRLRSAVDSAKSVMVLLRGEPTTDHLAGAAWRSRTPWTSDLPSPLDRGDGLRWFTPLMPLRYESANKYLSIANDVFQSYGFEPMYTFVFISGRVMCCPTTICFDPTCPEQSSRAKQCYIELISKSQSAGFFPYRASASNMNFGMKDGNQFWPVIKKLKESLDPYHVLAPGRYCST